MRRRPIQVYLDSSDYSLLSDSSKRTKEVSRVQRQLLEFRDTGLIEIRFSYAHVIEAAPVAPEHIPSAKARLECIEHLCQRKALVAPSTLMEHEIRLICEGGAASSDHYVYRDDGNWTPEVSEDLLDLPPPEIAIKENLETMQFGRAAKRKLERQYFSPSGELRPVARATLRRMLPSLVEKMRQSFPLTPSALEAIERYYSGRGSRIEVRAALMQSLSNLTCFADWFEKHWDKVSPTTNWLRDSGEGLRKTLLNIINQVESMNVRAAAAGLPDEQLLAISRSSFENLHSRFFANLVRTLASHIGVDAINVVETEPWRVAPGLFTAVEIMAAVAKASAFTLKGARVPKRSDLGDILHCLYIPFVDVFRADGFMANAIRSANVPTVKKVSASLFDVVRDIQDVSEL